MVEPNSSIWLESAIATVANSERSVVRRFRSARFQRDQHEAARDIARSFAGIDGFEQSRRERKKIEMRFAHLKRILRLGRLRLRGPRGAQDEFVLAAIAQNLRRLFGLPREADMCGVGRHVSKVHRNGSARAFTSSASAT